MTTRFDGIRDYLQSTHRQIVCVYYFTRDGEPMKETARALVKKSLTVKELRAELLIKLAAEVNEPTKYGLYIKRNLLPLDLTVGDLAELDTSGEIQLRLKSEVKQTIDDVLSLVSPQGDVISIIPPAIIGRHTPDMSQETQNEITSLGSLEGSIFVSRRHARIERQMGSYIITKLTDKVGQKLLLNDAEVPASGAKLEDGAKITFGTLELIFSCKPKA